MLVGDPSALALSTSFNFSVILPILFAKLAKTLAIAVATLMGTLNNDLELP